VVAYFFIEGDRTATARELMRSDPDWRLPALWRADERFDSPPEAMRTGRSVAAFRPESQAGRGLCVKNGSISPSLRRRALPAAHQPVGEVRVAEAH